MEPLLLIVGLAVVVVPVLVVVFMKYDKAQYAKALRQNEVASQQRKGPPIILQSTENNIVYSVSDGGRISSCSTGGGIRNMSGRVVIKSMVGPHRGTLTLKMKNGGKPRLTTTGSGGSIEGSATDRDGNTYDLAELEIEGAD